MQLDISISLILNLREARRRSRGTGRGKEAGAESGKQARRHSNPLCVVRVCFGREMSNVNSNLHPY